MTNTTAASGGLSLGGITSASSAAAPAPAGLAFGAASTGGLTLGTASTASTGLTLGGLTSASATTSSTGLTLGGAGSTQASLTSVTNTTSSAAASSGLTFRQLEENINKWTMELEDLEKVFINQATQVNAWDQLLIKNGEKIISLHESVSAVRLDQQRLEHELDFVAAQQSELEEMLKPLEASLASTGPVDSERERIYALAENLDGQLARMGEDLKEIISHLNTSAKSQDSKDPVYQIGKILNAHMDSLQWIDSNAQGVERKLSEVARLAEIHRRDSERLQRSMLE